MIPQWLNDPYYYALRDERRPQHLEQIAERRVVENKIAAAAGDGSYAILWKSGRAA